jgi:hypothetical protein
MKITFNDFLTEYLKSDAIGYNIGKFIYHTTPKRNAEKIERDGFEPKDGISVNGKKFKNRLYFATSLISAYDISVNFGSYKDDDDYVIFKVDSKCLDEYEKDPLFVHGIFVNYRVDKKYIVDIIKANDLFNMYDENDIENLY